MRELCADELQGRKDVLTAGIAGICDVLRVLDLLDRSHLGHKGWIVSSRSVFCVSCNPPLN